ncbi:hypothetical protein H7F15_03980 [Pontibacter sp. Tf4]|uniref:hypothetical protein n=1 Tax=Pontibacter sp. Tf4 TaxID=2761620 RepID=UPI0016252002|nr:hypothetical protein [Pontibacter sp. Tf4]MBB6610188.1 hypothetical protein [Pontibacter sp. Tf4]
MTSDKNTTSKWLKIGAWLIGIALILFVGFFFFSGWLQGKVERMTEKESNGLYKLKLHGLDVSPFLGHLEVDSLTLEPNYERWQQLKQEKQHVPRMLFRIRTAAFSASGLNLLGIAFGKPLDASELNLQEPDILLTEMHPDTTERHKAAYQVATGILRNMQIGQIIIADADFRYRDYFRDSTVLLEVKKFTLTAGDFRLDSLSFEATDRAFYTRKAEFKSAGITYRFPDGQYHVTTGALTLNSAAQTIAIRNLHLKPQRTARQLSRAKGKAVTSNDLKIKKVQLKGVDYHTYFRKEQFLANYLLLDKPVLRSYKTRKSGEPEERKPLPHDMVQHIKTPFLIDTLKVRNGDVRYTELALAAQEPGSITLNSLYATITNLSNMPAHISDKKPALLQSSFLVMNKAKVRVWARLPLLNKAGYHTIAGTFGSARPAILNPILIPTASIKIEEGYIRKGEFKAELTARKATGTMLVYYDNLGIELLKKGEGNEQGLGKKIISKVADWVAIKDANPMKGEQPRTGHISVTRDPNASVLSYWKTCVVSGFLDTIGLEKAAKK